jgi:hypothetical protein
LPEALIKPVFMFFVILLIGLMILVTYSDIIRQLPRSAKAPVPVNKDLKAGQDETKP